MVSTWPTRTSVECCPVGMLGPPSRSHDKAQAPGEASGYVDLWSRCLHHPSGPGPPDSPAQIPKPHRSYRSQQLGSSTTWNHKQMPVDKTLKSYSEQPQPWLLPAGFLLQLSHLCTWLLSLVPLCPPTRQDQGQPACLAWSRYSKNASIEESTGDKIQVRSGSMR